MKLRTICNILSKNILVSSQPNDVSQTPRVTVVYVNTCRDESADDESANASRARCREERWLFRVHTLIFRRDTGVQSFQRTLAEPTLIDNTSTGNACVVHCIVCVCSTPSTRLTSLLPGKSTETLLAGLRSQLKFAARRYFRAEKSQQSGRNCA